MHLDYCFYQNVSLVSGGSFYTQSNGQVRTFKTVHFSNGSTVYDCGAGINSHRFALFFTGKRRHGNSNSALSSGVLSFISIKNEKFKNFISGRPSIIIDKGTINVKRNETAAHHCQRSFLNSSDCATVLPYPM